METLSGLTPALSRRLQKQLLAHLPPAAARTLRRTLSMQNTNAAKVSDHQNFARSLSASKTMQDESSTDKSVQLDLSSICSDKTEPSEVSVTDSQHSGNIDKDSPKNLSVLTEKVSAEPVENSVVLETENLNKHKPSTPDIVNLPKLIASDDNEFSKKELDVPIPQFSTLPRPKKHLALSREATPPAATAIEFSHEFSSPKINLPSNKEQILSRGSSACSTPDRSLLSKYLTPDRTISLEESYSSDSGSLLSEPSYIAAYGTPAISSVSGPHTLRRHSMRMPGEQPRKRISRFLRPDFFDTPRDESLYARAKKDKELETQKILREIREKRLRTSDVGPKNTSEKQQAYKEDLVSPRSCLSPNNLLYNKDDILSPSRCLSPTSVFSSRERSRSITPYYPILDNIKETVLDSLHKNVITDKNHYKVNVNAPGQTSDNKLHPSPPKESKLARPKSFPVKNIAHTGVLSDNEITNLKSMDVAQDLKEKPSRDSKLIRPKSYPSSSPSPEKAYITRNNNISNDDANTGNKNNVDIAVSFNVNLPKKIIYEMEKLDVEPAAECKNKDDKSQFRQLEPKLLNNTENTQEKSKTLINISPKIDDASPNKQVLQKKDIFDKTREVAEPIKRDSVDTTENLVGKSEIDLDDSRTGASSVQILENNLGTKDRKESKPDSIEEKKSTVKKKIIKKISKSKTTEGVSQEASDSKKSPEKKKIVRRIKEKDPVNDHSIKKINSPKKKSVLQSIGQKLEKLTSKSNSPEKEKSESVNAVDDKSKSKPLKLIQNQREQSVPINAEPITESSLIKRAVTLTNVTGLDRETGQSSKTAVSKVLGLFKKFESKDKSNKETPQDSNNLVQCETPAQRTDVLENDSTSNIINDKPKRPTSLLLNGLGRQYRQNDSSSTENNDLVSLKNMSHETTNINNEKIDKNNLKLDFSRLPRIKQNTSSYKPTTEIDNKDTLIGKDVIPGVVLPKKSQKNHNSESQSDSKLDHLNMLQNAQSSENSDPSVGKTDRNQDKDSSETIEARTSLCSAEGVPHHPQRIHEPTTPEKEDIVDRIRRKSFYSRFNEKRHKRKSNLVGPGVPEYNPAVRLHPHMDKYDASPTSPVKFPYPGDLSPTQNTERYRTLNPESPSYLRYNTRFDNYGLGDRVENYRSLDRNDLKKYSSNRTHLDSDGSATSGCPRYNRTKSLFETNEDGDEGTVNKVRDSHTYNRTYSMYSPGNYATYRPKRIRNPAILLKDNEKELGPGNVLDKIREKKIASNFTKIENHSESKARSNVSSKSEGDGAECSEKVD